MKTINPVVHFEMPYDDEKRMSDFYTSAFGWETTSLGGPMGNYVLVATGENDEKGSPKTAGRINGGFYQKKDDMPAQYPSLVLAVEDIQESMKKIEEAGGKVLGEPIEIPGYGMYISFFDTEGNRNGLMQPNQGM